jgi:ribosomal protein S18 acetylase RimI-like enzyme
MDAGRGVAVRVWTASSRDVEAVASLIAAFRSWWGKDEPTLEEIHATTAILLDDPNTEFLLAAPGDGEAAAGVCQLRYRLSVWTGADDCWLEDLYVDDAARGAGLGRALVEAAFERARKRGCRRMELDVNEENTAAIAFYESLGFTTEPKPPGRTLFVSRKL